VSFAISRIIVPPKSILAYVTLHDSSSGLLLQRHLSKLQQRNHGQLTNITMYALRRKAVQSAKHIRQPIRPYSTPHADPHAAGAHGGDHHDHGHHDHAPPAPESFGVSSLTCLSLQWPANMICNFRLASMLS
jgi:hypothetical protein